MTNRAAIGLAIMLAGLYGLSLVFVDEPLVFLGRKFLDLVGSLAFWR